MVWELAWKAVAVRKAVVQRDWRWVPTLIVVNSAGLLPLWYVFLHRARPRAQERAG
jgi:hypothetical protein